MCDDSKNKINGFTLIELSIVLVIISLIVGGIIGGKSLINTARVHNIITQVNEYKVAVNNFNLQYDAVPGDFNDGFSYWGTDCDADAEDCNGDGNGMIDECSSCGFRQESLRAWQHLELAKLINHSLTGEQDNSSAPTWASIGVNIPAGPIDGTAFELRHGAWTETHSSFGKNGNNINYGSVYPGDNYLSNGALNVKNTVAIDKKMDDGAADGGYVRPTTLASSSSYPHECTGGTDARFNASGSYNLSSSYEDACRVLFFFN